MLTGWPARRMAIVHCDSVSNSHGAVVQAMYDACPTLTQWEPIPNKKPEPEEQPVDDAPPAVEESKPSKKDKKRDKTAAGGTSPDKSARSKSKPSSTAGSAVDATPPPAPVSPADTTTRPTYVGASVAEGHGHTSERAARLRLVLDGNRPVVAPSVRVLECLYIPGVLHGADPDFNDVTNWVVQCQSHMHMLLGGQLAYSNDNAWTTSLTQVTRLSREYADVCNARSLAQIAEGCTFTPITWYANLRIFASASVLIRAPNIIS